MTKPKVGDEVSVYELCRNAGHDEYQFVFEFGGPVYMTRGGCSYSNVAGYDGGPWYASETRPERVRIVAARKA